MTPKAASPMDGASVDAPHEAPLTGAFYVLESGGRFRLHCSDCGYVAPNTFGTITTSKAVCPWSWIGGHHA
jgi:hypothetical protein